MPNDLHVYFQSVTRSVDQRRIKREWNSAILVAMEGVVKQKLVGDAKLLGLYKQVRFAG